MRCVHAGRRAVFTSAESFSTLRLRSASSRAGVARHQQQQHRARPLWRWPSGATYQLFEDPFPQERTQLGCGVMKFSLAHTTFVFTVYHYTMLDDWPSSTQSPFFCRQFFIDSYIHLFRYRSPLWARGAQSACHVSVSGRFGYNRNALIY
jgi:hypothetical protein